jgi:hypothetical protein
MAASALICALILDSHAVTVELLCHVLMVALAVAVHVTV